MDQNKRKTFEAKIINSLITQRDEEHNKVFNKVTYEGIVQEEIRLKALKQQK